MAAQKTVNLNTITDAIKTMNGELANQMDSTFKKNIDNHTTALMAEVTQLRADVAELKMMLQQIQTSLATNKAPKPKPQVQSIESSDSTKQPKEANAPKVPAQPGMYFKVRYHADPTYKEHIDTTFKNDIEAINKALTPSDKTKKDVVLSKLWTLIGKKYPDTKAELINVHAQLRSNVSQPTKEQPTTTIPEETQLTTDNIDDIDE